MSTPFSDRAPAYRDRLGAVVERCLPADDHYPARLHAAMRYSVDGGKRLRALLVYAAGEVLGLPPEALDAPAAAVELIHAYSLVHDDLPAMDDDDLRRGRATTHIAYDEATAILVGDALQALAFEVLAADSATAAAPTQRLRMVALLAEAAGSRGMVGGQAVDLESEGLDLNLAELEALHIHKTGALIRACLRMACAAASAASPDQIDALDRYGKCIGLAFQIQDDILDIESNAATLGKSIGKDEAQGKSTYPSVMGLPAARERAESLFSQARAALEVFGAAAAPLLFLADLIQGRDH
ncbi:geranyl transferase [Sinimarinibacterium sp. CAU 1509]|uniref:polyprenyl synthetase family protein n=1 Tax=Sinimarinibacterium sp. CAU 1509 TaxID=2562283 RepID=UPI0010ABDE04|nr:farnesyl diphosphate synthase [Sinimarinibacterium sp. CAU 1509]TJY61092.1 geranyl transferase [Sinimarinibacterium sp. CAU 1509]